MDWDDGGTPVGMTHHVVAAVDPYHSEADALQCPDDLGSRFGRDVSRHKAASYQKSGYVECQSQLIRWPDLYGSPAPVILQRWASRGRPLSTRATRRETVSLAGATDAAFIPYWLGGLTDHAVGTEDEEAVEGAGEPAVVGNCEHRSLVGLQAVLECLGRL